MFWEHIPSFLSVWHKINVCCLTQAGPAGANVMMWCCCSGQEMSCVLGKRVSQLRWRHHSPYISVLFLDLILLQSAEFGWWLIASFHVTAVSVLHIIVWCCHVVCHLLKRGMRQQQVIFQYLLQWADALLEEIWTVSSAGQHCHLVAGNLLKYYIVLSGNSFSTLSQAQWNSMNAIYDETQHLSCPNIKHQKQKWKFGYKVSQYKQFMETGNCWVTAMARPHFWDK